MPWVYATRPRYWSSWGRYARKGTRVMARRASRPGTPYAGSTYPPLSVVEDIAPPTKRASLLDPDWGRGRLNRLSRTTRSSVIKLTANVGFQFVQGDSTSGFEGRAFRFSLNDIPGFTDYQSVYSEYRILRGEIVFPTQIGPTSSLSNFNNYLVVSSQPFAQTAIPIPDASDESWVPNQTEAALRQTRWQRIIYPESTTTGVRVGFYPYTMVATEGPAGSTTVVQYQRIWSGRAWTPFTWSSDTTPITYFGPYVFPQSNITDSPDAFNVNVTLILYLLFKGQK